MGPGSRPSKGTRHTRGRRGPWERGKARERGACDHLPYRSPQRPREYRLIIKAIHQVAFNAHDAVNGRHAPLGKFLLGM